MAAAHRRSHRAEIAAEMASLGLKPSFPTARVLIGVLAGASALSTLGTLSAL